MGYVPMKPKLRSGPVADAGRRTLEVGGVTRSYWVPPQPLPDPPLDPAAKPLPDPAARPPPDAATQPPPDAPPHAAPDPLDRPPPLLLAFHGQGSWGSRMARWSGLATAGPRAGFRCVFPDALATVWDDHGCGRRDGADDVAFVTMLIEHIAGEGEADPERLFLTGVSSGATFVERLVRTGVVEPGAMALVSGTARVATTETTPIVARPTSVLLMAGTGDPIAPYHGGLPGGSIGRIALRRVATQLVDPSGHESVPPEELAAEWAEANECAPPRTDTLARAPGEFAVDRLTWDPANGRGAVVTLYRIVGAGHGWPGGKQYLPARLIGRIPQHIDGSKVVLEFARAALGRLSPLW